MTWSPQHVSLNFAHRAYLVIPASLALASSILGTQSVFSSKWVDKVALYPQYRKVTHYSLWEYSRLTHSTEVFVQATILIVCVLLLGIHSALIFKKIWSHSDSRWLYRISAINVSILLLVRLLLPITREAKFHISQHGFFESWQLGAGHIGLSWACLLSTASILTFKMARRHLARK